MCTAVVSNISKTIIGWNLDILDMQHKVVAESDKTYIAVNDKTEGWMPLFGANSRGDFVTMPTCWPFDERSNPASAEEKSIIKLNIDLLLKKKTFSEIKLIAENEKICSVPGVTFQAQLSDKNGSVLQIVPGQGYRCFEKPRYSVMTNFSPFKGGKEAHPWMGLDRYSSAIELLESCTDEFCVRDCFNILKAASQTICPTVVSMVFDVSDNTVYWCENKSWDDIKINKMKRG